MDIHHLWRSFYPDETPIAYLLREQIPHKWLRAHCLPQSKRYADNEDETREILRCYNRMASEVLGENAPCVVFFPDYADHIAPKLLANFERQFFEQFRAEDLQVMLFAAATRWQSHQFDAILRRVANDEIRYVSWLNAETGEIFAPYDGGADLLLDSGERRDALATKYKNWLSIDPQGL